MEAINNNGENNIIFGKDIVDILKNLEKLLPNQKKVVYDFAIFLSNRIFRKNDVIKSDELYSIFSLAIFEVTSGKDFLLKINIEPFSKDDMEEIEKGFLDLVKLIFGEVELERIKGHIEETKTKVERR